MVLYLAIVILFSLQPATAEQPALTREEILNSLGSPQSTLQRGTREIFSYPDGTRVEIVDGEVLSIHRGAEPLVIDRAGVRYTVGPGGKLERQEAAPHGWNSIEEEEPQPEEPPLPQAEAPTSGGSAVEMEIFQALQAAYPELHAYPFEEKPELPRWAGPASIFLGLLVRAGVILLLLRITLGWMREPVFYGDLLKVSLLYTAVHDAVDAVGRMGGFWQLIHIFQVAEIISFFVLAAAIFRFGVARSGLTALKIAIGTKIAAFALMLGAGLVISFVLLALS
jgi:hypothetical protein